MYRVFFSIRLLWQSERSSNVSIIAASKVPFMKDIVDVQEMCGPKRKETLWLDEIGWNQRFRFHIKKILVVRNPTYPSVDETTFERGSIDLRLFSTFLLLSVAGKNCSDQTHTSSLFIGHNRAEKNETGTQHHEKSRNAEVLSNYNSRKGGMVQHHERSFITKRFTK